MTDRTFSSAELFGQTSTSAQMTEPFSAEHRFVFFTIYCIPSGYLIYFKLDRKMKLFYGDNFRQKFSTTFKIVLLVRSGVPPDELEIIAKSRIQAPGFLYVFMSSVLFCAFSTLFD